MRTTIRQATFETNSSSVHAFVFLAGGDYARFRNDEVALDLSALQRDHGEWTWESDEIDGSPYLVEADKARELISERIGSYGLYAYESDGTYDPTDVEVFFHSDGYDTDAYESEHGDVHGLEFDYMG